MQLCAPASERKRGRDREDVRGIDSVIAACELFEDTSYAATATAADDTGEILLTDFCVFTSTVHRYYVFFENWKNTRAEFSVNKYALFTMFLTWQHFSLFFIRFCSLPLSFTLDLPSALCAESSAVASVAK